MGYFAFTRTEQRFISQSVGNRVIGRKENQGSSSRGVSLATASLNQVPQCINYEKFHHGECRLGSGGYFKCGQLDHQRKDCPNNTLARGLLQKPNTSPRI